MMGRTPSFGSPMASRCLASSTANSPHTRALHSVAHRNGGNAGRVQNEYLSASISNRLPSGGHPSGPGGSYHFCSFASCQCAVLGGFMGLASAATTAVVQSLCAAAVQSLWGGRG